MTDILEKKQIIETDAEQISLPGFVRLVKARKKLFYVVMPIVLVVAICILYSLPRYYTTQTSWHQKWRTLLYRVAHSVRWHPRLE